MIGPKKITANQTNVMEGFRRDKKIVMLLLVRVYKDQFLVARELRAYILHIAGFSISFIAG